ncbi:hypothetical protein [Clostridium oryzae]|uniref:Uncharacterized protein n=1 Tax=Clostridium oryzae TaxID=1450648 RepID=A0A1V4ILI2_9CLOT|nr:hypothetical protein [Clostridium oryzae]OPJ60337.1 hypothetical protein CLORY_29120 [Clostridium oryzae]
MKNHLKINTTTFYKSISLLLLSSIFCLTAILVNFSAINVRAASKKYTVYYHINKFTQKNSSRYLTVDKLYWVSDSHHADDYYIINKSKKLRTYKVSSKVKFYIVFKDYNVIPETKVNYSEFKKYVMKEPTYYIIQLKFKGNEIIEAREIYTP